MGSVEIKIPGPKGHFLTGSLPEIQHDRLSFLLDLARTYTDELGG